VATAYYLPHLLKRNEDFEIVAVCDTSERRTRAYARLLGVPHLYTEYFDMLRRADIEAALILTGPGTPARFAIAAAESGRHILQKPMALDLTDAHRIAGAVRKSRVTALSRVVFTCRALALSPFVSRTTLPPQPMSGRDGCCCALTVFHPIPYSARSARAEGVSMSHGARRPRSGSSRSSSGSSGSSGSALPPQFPPASFPPASFPPSDGGLPDDPETVRKWHNRRADVIALELILRAERVDTLGSLFRLTTAPPTARLFAVISTYLYAKEHGLLRE
jgi:hypothetical protein